MAQRNSEKKKEVTGNEAGAIRSQQSHDLLTVAPEATYGIVLNGEALWGFYSILTIALTLSLDDTWDYL